jgi:hexosaminidase
MPLAAHALVPCPRSVRLNDDTSFTLSADTVVAGPADAVATLTEAVAVRTGIRLPPSSLGETQLRRSSATLRGGDASDGVSTTVSAVVSAIDLAVSGAGATEAYRLAVTAGSVRIEGTDAAGLQHGIHTLMQLLASEGDHWSIPAIEIDDAPRFAHRGLMLDVARHFFPVPVVTRLIDAAAALKLNVLHLHLSDDQGWRLALTSRPELQTRAAGTSVGGDPGGYYSADDYRAILEHAAQRHMTVIPEFDGPGHTHAVGLAYPEVAADPTVTDDVLAAVRDFGGGVPTRDEPYTGLAVGFSSLRVGSPEADAFLADVFGELAALTPGPFLHIGGDEALGTSDEDYTAYVAHVTRLVTELGKIPVAWHEAGTAAAPGTVGQYWGFATRTDAEAGARLAEFVRRGGRVILSPADAVYLDMKPRADAPLGLVWAEGPTSVERSYRWDPTTVVTGIEEDDILGVEAALWTETIRSEADIDAMVFPRLASAAEIAWSPGAAPERTWASFRERVAGLAPGWTAAGIRFDRAPEIPWRPF